jgi:hypothetical protein
MSLASLPHYTPLVMLGDFGLRSHREYIHVHEKKGNHHGDDTGER